MSNDWYKDEVQLRKALDTYDSCEAIAAAYGHTPTSETLRRWAKRLGIELRCGARPQVKRTVESSGVVSREEVLEAEVNELQAALALERKRGVRDERVVQRLERLVPAFKPIYSPPPLEHGSPRFAPHAFVLQWSDLHAAERVFSDQMGGINEYDWEIMLRRHDKIINALTSFKEHRPYPVYALHIAAGGDMVTGDIHDELRVTNEKTIMETALQLGLDGSRFIERLVPLFDEIIVHCVVGNHGRLTKKPQAKNQHDNFDWIVYHLLKLTLANYPNVTVNVPKSAYTWFKVFDFTFFMLHGDGISTNMPGIPWGGLQRRIRELERQFEPVAGRIDHFLVHHFHQPNAVDNWRIIVNGSVKGPDEYSIKRYGAGAPAAQNLLTVHPERGLTDIAKLNLQ